MNHEKMFSQVIKLIDENPSKKWTLEEMAQKFHYSPYHFHRLFKEISGETFQRFVLKRRLSYSAEDLMSDEKSILDVALQYEYQSHEAFSRAFKNNLHLTPSHFREKQATYPFFKQNFLFPSNIQVHNPALESIPSFVHMGIKAQNDDHVGSLWGLLVAEIDVSSYQKLIGVISHPDSYTAGVEMNDKSLPQLNNVMTIPESLYVTINHHESYATIINTYEYIYQTWLPKSPYSFDQTKPQLEIYEENKPVKICIPIQEVET